MAEETKAAEQGIKGLFGKKVGPLPLGVWVLAAAGIWYVVSKRSSSSSTQATDPAGNVGVIDPATGYVYGSSQDQAALAASSGGGTGSTTDTSSSNSTTAGVYADNDAWGRAAVNYLVGLGVDPTQASEAIQQYLSSQVLTSQQQGDVNLAIQALGPPPTLPESTGTAPANIISTPSGPTAANPPTGLVVSTKTANSVSLKWNACANATGYTVQYGKTAAATDGSITSGAEVTSATVSGLSASTLYYFRVQGTPAKSGDPFASVSTTTSATGATSTPATTTTTAAKHHTVTVVKYTSKNPPWNSTIWGIANHYGISSWQTVWNDPHNAALKKKRGVPEHIQPGDQVYVPA